MKIAVMSTRPDALGTVPDTFETAPALLIVETDNGSIVEVLQSAEPMDYTNKIVEAWVEAVVCGVHIGQRCFDPIADESITRYDGAGLNVIIAARMADKGNLPIIPEYEGGPGCDGGGGECGEGHCHEHEE